MKLAAVAVIIAVVSFAAGFYTRAITGRATSSPSSVVAATTGTAREAKIDDPAARAAISALNDLRAATKIGVTFGDYQRRLTDTGVVVERHLASITTGETSGAVTSSLHYYALAAHAFRGRVSGGQTDFNAISRLREDSALDDCGRLKPAVEAFMRSSFQESYVKEHPVNRAEVANSIVQGRGGTLEALWLCAADKLAEAEKILAGEK